MLRRWLGLEGEKLAERFLRARGLELVTRNYRCRHGEIDLVMREGGSLVFVEVRRRSRSDYGGAAASVDTHKQKRLIAAARHYLAHYAGEPPPCRFDVVAIDGAGAPQWLPDAFADMP